MGAQKIPNLVYSFAPIINAKSKILILGSLPSVMSLSKGQYFANPKNQFWTIIYRVFEESVVDVEYEDRIKFLLEHGIALWDVFQLAEREGSSDAKIKNGTPNNITGLLRGYPGIKRIVVAGGKAATAFRSYFPEVAVEVVNVPSTSPIPGKNIKTLEEKTQIWRRAIRERVGENYEDC